ncbi:MAG: SGNH/GDSL hydrolase family protein [Halioglobus sp.]
MTKYGKLNLYDILFVVIHTLGVALCLFTLGQMWEHQVLLRLLLERIPIVNLLGGLIPTLILSSLITTTAIFGTVKVFRLLWTWHRGETIQDAAVWLRIGLYVGVGYLCCCIFILSTPESFSGPFRLRHTIAAWIAASLAYAMWCALPTLGSRFSSRTRRRLNLIGMNVLLALILAEVVLRIASVVWASPLLITESTSSQIRRDSERVQPGVERFSFPINSAGHYDTEFLPPSDRSLPLVVNIGDSFSYGVVPHYYHYTTVAEREFPDVEIYNIGFPGTNPVDYLYHLVEEVLPLEPDLVVIALFVGNDIVAQAAPASPTRWYDAQRYMVGIVWHRLQILRRARSSDWTQDYPDMVGENLVSRYPWLIDPSQETPSMSEDIYVELEARNAYQGAIDHPGVYERFFAALRQIEDAASDVPLAFLIIPDEYQLNDELWQAVVEKNELPLQRDLPQRKIREWARDGNRDIVDLLPLLLAEERLPDGRRHLYHLRDTHFNARGNAIAGRGLAKLIEAKLTEGEKPDFVKQSPQASPQNAAPQNAVSSDEATEILLLFGTLIADLGVNGTTVFDDSLLNHPKDEIKSAIVIVLNGESTADQQAFARGAAQVLAFFQPGVGKAGFAMDSMRADQTTWKSQVQAEMQKNILEIASRTVLH